MANGERRKKVAQVSLDFRRDDVNRLASPQCGDSPLQQFVETRPARAEIGRLAGAPEHFESFKERSK
ncbi:MAG: hypothetical protein PVSMB1_10760 [Gemmatimonadaceae bacterium]